MSLPAPAYAITVDPHWNNVPVDAIEVVAADGSPAVDQVVILWDQQSYQDQEAILAALPAIGSPGVDVRAVLEAAGVTPGYTTIPSTYPRPGAPININDTYYNGSAWVYVYNDSAV